MKKDHSARMTRARSRNAVASLFLLAGAMALGACDAKPTGAAADARQPAGAEARGDAKSGKTADSKSTAAKPALTVTVAEVQTEDWPRTLSANGSIAAWQEASVGAEAQGLRMTEVMVNVGDTVKRGQMLARLSDASVQADLAQQRAAIAEAEAQLADAQANAARARQLDKSGAISAQQIAQLLTAEQTSRARLEAARARLRADTVRLTNTRILAPDDGVISVRTATVGAVVQPGQELFRLIRRNRLEWRGEVTAAELGAIATGQTVQIEPASGARIEGRVRMIAPTVDPATRNALVYVDLESNGAARAGMFARGEFQLGTAPARTLPSASVLRREGFHYVYALEPDSRVRQIKISVGRRSADRVEVTDGLPTGTKVVASGAGFLSDGDLVRVEAAAASTHGNGNNR
jgi:RND family efflux transporter MFP subunit